MAVYRRCFVAAAADETSPPRERQLVGVPATLPVASVRGAEGKD